MLPIPSPSIANISRLLPIATSAEGLRNHIVICGYMDASLMDLLWTIRKQSLTKSVPVLVVFETLPDSDLHQALSEISDVTLMVGSLQSPSVLMSANLAVTSQIILLANPFAKSQSDIHDQVTYSLAGVQSGLGFQTLPSERKPVDCCCRRHREWRCRRLATFLLTLVAGATGRSGRFRQHRIAVGAGKLLAGKVVKRNRH